MEHLHITLSTADAKPIFKQIIDTIRLQIAEGILQPGHKLPSIRALAMEQTISVNTVAKAYNILMAQGILISKPGQGVFVDQRRQLLTQAEQEKMLNRAIDNFISDISQLTLQPSMISDRLKLQLADIKPLSKTTKTI